VVDPLPIFQQKTVSDFIDISLKVVGNPVVPILLLQFAAQHEGEEAEAKLARQIPRQIGRKLRLTDRFDARFLSFRDKTTAGDVVFVNSTGLPESEALAEIAAHHGIRYILTGKIGIGERITIEAHVYDAQRNGMIFRKGFDTYATYTFDVFDEICVRTAMATGQELSREERVAIFQRDTTEWEAFLYYLLAEDDRYGLSVGIPPADPSLAAQAFTAALERDPDFATAEQSATAYIIEALEAGILTTDQAEKHLAAIATAAPALLSARHALMFLSLEKGNDEAARRYAAEILKIDPENAEAAEIAG
jgi:hypothetical protein